MSNNVKVHSPIGFCVKCTLRGRRVQATAIRNGDGLCDACTIDAGQVTQAWNGLMPYGDGQASDGKAHG